MPASFPTAIRQFTTKRNNVDDVLASDVDDLQNEIAAIENALGISPQGGASDVAGRIAAIEAAQAALVAPQTSTCVMSRSTNLPVPNSAWTALNPDSRDFYSSHVDEGSSVFEANGHFYGLKQGLLLVSAKVSFAANATGVRRVRVVSSTGLVFDRATIVTANTADDYVSLTTSFPVAASASVYYFVEVYQSSGGNLNALSNTTTNPTSVSASLIPV